MSDPTLSKATRVCERCKTPTLRAIDERRYRGVQRVTFACDRCGGGFTAVDSGPYEAGFMGLVGLGFVVVPSIGMWWKNTPEETTPEPFSVGRLLDMWRDSPLVFGGCALLGLLLLGIFVLPWVRQRRTLARNPVAR